MKNLFMLRALAIAMATVSFVQASKDSLVERLKDKAYAAKEPVHHGFHHRGWLVNNSGKDVEVRFVFNDPEKAATEFALLAKGKSLPLPDLPDGKPNDPTEALVLVKGVDDPASAAHVLEWQEGKSYSITERRTTHLLVEVPDKDGKASKLINHAQEPVRYKFVRKGENPDKVEYEKIEAGAWVKIPEGENIQLRVKTATKGTDRSPFVTFVEDGNDYQIFAQTKKFQTALFFHSGYISKLLQEHREHREGKKPARKAVDDDDKHEKKRKHGKEAHAKHGKGKKHTVSKEHQERKDKKDKRAKKDKKDKKDKKRQEA